MSKKSIVFVTMFGTLAGAIGLIQLPIATASLSSVPTLTLYVSRTVNMVDTKTWCKPDNAIGTGRPFGFNKVLFYKDKLDTKERDYLIGCVTNNSGESIDSLLANYSFHYQSGSSTYRTIAGFNHIILLNFKKGQTAFFKSEFKVDPQASVVNIEIMKKNQGQTTTDETVEQLIIHRR